MTDDTESKHEFHYADHGVAGGWPHPASACDPTPEPTDPQPVTVTITEERLAEVMSGHDLGYARPDLAAADLFAALTAPPLTPREGDLVETPGGYSGQVVAAGHGVAVVDTGDGFMTFALDQITVTDRPPKRPVRVWLTDEQVRSYARVTRGCYTPVGDACRALVDEG